MSDVLNPSTPSAADLNHEEAEQLAHLRSPHSNLARCYLALRSELAEARKETKTAQNTALINLSVAKQARERVAVLEGALHLYAIMPMEPWLAVCRICGASCLANAELQHKPDCILSPVQPDSRRE